MSRADGVELGKYAATIEVSLLKGRQPDDTVHHLGDDIGNAITNAYHADGIDAATDVLDGYLSAFNDVRRASGLLELTPAAATKNMAWAFSSRGLSDDEQEQVRTEFLRRN